MGAAEPLGIYRCSKCNKSYSKSDLKKLKKTKKGHKCKCGGIVKEIKSLPGPGLSLTFTEPHGGVEKYYYQMHGKITSFKRGRQWMQITFYILLHGAHFM